MIGFVLAFAIGLALGVLGGGGSILTIPVLHYVMGYGMREAVPMSLVVVGVTGAVGTLGHLRQHNVELRTAFGFGIPAIVGAVFGADLGPRVADDLRLTIFAVILLAAAFSMFRGERQGGRAAGRQEATGRHGGKAAPDSGEDKSLPPPGRPAARPSGPGIPGVTLIGAATGFLTGFVGVGGGFIYVPVLTLLVGLPVRRAIGTSLVLIVLSCAAGIARYLGHPELGSLDWSAIAIFTGIALAGVLLGGRLAPGVSQAHLRKGFAAFLLVLGFVVLFVRR